MQETTPHQKFLGLTLTDLAGPGAGAIIDHMIKAQQFLTDHTDGDLLKLIGTQIHGIDASNLIDKAVIQQSYGGGHAKPTDDLLAGRGVFYVSEKGKLYLDCTAGHYQVTWGYNHPVLIDVVRQGLDNGVVSDNHSNIPQWPVKRLARSLVEAANPDMPELRSGDFSRIMAANDRLNTVLIGLATGSVACESALKIMLMQHERLKKASPAVVVVLKGNYHGTGIAMQYLRDMWPAMIKGFEVVSVEPNDVDQLEAVFAMYGERIAGFWAEPIMMNREALAIEPAYLQIARERTAQVGALMIIDEIQTGFWMPEVFMYRRFGITPDIVIVGKGMTAGFHPLSAIIYRRPLDMLAQYDAISTNGNAALAALVALANMALTAQNAERINHIQVCLFDKLKTLAEEFPDRIAAIHGCPAMAGLKFHSREDALSFHRRSVDSGLWLRAHAYHEGHSTVLMKFALCVDTPIVDEYINRLRNLLTHT
ncbi:MAG: aminotransferase class III-fold pyridoxal phosphate-dependent enzyme [Sedimentisphaerales bacterium]|nr:aminotransferase class III-fold pyridoxal phosphate-dependent enzyme [Sedimentisphaerales bacterium]